jgi:hypothetical protein
MSLAKCRSLKIGRTEKLSGRLCDEDEDKLAAVQLGYKVVSD